MERLSKGVAIALGVAGSIAIAGAQGQPPVVPAAGTAQTTNAPTSGPLEQAPAQQAPQFTPLPEPAPLPLMELTNFPSAGAVQPAAAGAASVSGGRALAGTSQLAGPPGAGPVTAVPPLLRWGPVQLHPHLDYSISYGNSLQFSPGQTANTVINQVSPGITALLGTHWTLDYTPTLRFYSSPGFQDGTDQAVSLAGQTVYGDWTLGLSQSYGSSTQPLVEVGGQLGQEAYSTAVTASDQLSSKVSIDLSLGQNFRFVDQGQVVGQVSDWREWSTMDWLNYKLWPQLTVGAGLGVGYDRVDVGGDDVFEDMQGRVVWNPGSKMSVVATGGVDYRQYLSSGGSAGLTPIFSLALQYQPFAYTTLFISGGRSVAPSYYGGAVSESTTLNAGITQRLLGEIHLNVTGGYGDTTYKGTSQTIFAAPVSSYTSTSVNVSLSTTIFTRGTASVFYNVDFLSSGAAIYDYTTKQAGLSLGYRF
jgi:hypothetical protein